MDATSVDLKKTVNLPKTEFPMQANLPVLEPRLLDRWETSNIYSQIRQARAGAPQYVLHDGPPYANGNIHLGTAFNKILKDFIVKSKTMAGFDAPYIPGWDCHGLPIEIKVDAELGKRKAAMTTAEIRGECRAYAANFVDVHRREFKRLGVFGRWQDPYLTMSAEYEAVIAGAFVDFLHSGSVYKGLKPVHWCIKDRTALAEAEVEYENHSSTSIYVRFKLLSDPALLDPSLAGKEIYCLIWTTTPWTLPANLAISFNPKFEYVAVHTVGDGLTIVAAGLLPEISDALGWDARVVASFPGTKLDRAVFQHPFLARESLGLLGDHVTLEQGTGAVHTAPGHGQDDFVVCQRYGLPVYCPVDAGGRLFRAEGASGTLPEEIIGKTVWEINPIIIEILQQQGALAGQARLEHSYPHCWRCHRPIIFRATEQWFIGMDREDLRTRALQAVRGVKWHPGWGEDRMYNMIATRPDWCISRQRVWGVPIIVFYCNDCAQPFIDKEVQLRVVDKFRQGTSDVWYSDTVEELMGPACRCSNCGGSSFRKENDILDVWFDSGSSHLVVVNEKNGLHWPADMYIEGGDQYRGWFHSSLLIGVGLRGTSPYRECATHGWTLDAEGRAMHKSLGNTIEPEKIIKQYGADLLRLWVASVDFTEDVRLSDTILKRLAEAYRKIRNTIRAMLGNLYDFSPSIDQLPGQHLTSFDVWLLTEAEDLVRRCRAFYEEYEFHKVYRAVYDFTITRLSALFIDVSRDRLYTTAPSSSMRRSAQTTLHRVMTALVRLLAPVLSFTCEETWGYLGLAGEAGESIHTQAFPNPEEVTNGISQAQRSQASDWGQLLLTRDQVLKALDRAREDKVIGSSLEAALTLGATGETYDLFQRNRSDLAMWFIVSHVDLQAGSGEPLKVTVERASGDKCERCWKYKLDIGTDDRVPTVCAECANVLEQTGHLS